METELKEETTIQDVELAETCAGCGGPVVVRLTPGTARGVCRKCRLVTGMALVKGRHGVTMIQAPSGLA